MNKLSDWLIKELNNRGWSQRELSRRAGISPTQISDVIKETSNPGADFCLAIARALDVQPETIMRRAGILPSLPPEVEEEREMVNLFRRLGDETRRVLLATARQLLGLPRSPKPDEPRTLSELLAYHIEKDAALLTEEEQRQLFDLMEHVRGDKGIVNGDAQVETN